MNQTHSNYFEIEANHYYELGYSIGELFFDEIHYILEYNRSDNFWKTAMNQSLPYYSEAEKLFPTTIQEIEGMSAALKISKTEMFTLAIEDELLPEETGKCTTIVTNDGLLIAHNEDWIQSAKNFICVLKKSIKDQSIFELFYIGTLGGNSASINSNGIAHFINSLTHRNHQTGVPKNIMARWLQETNSPRDDFKTLSRIKKSSGHHHLLASRYGELWSWECSVFDNKLSRPTSPFIHTNHFLSSLKNTCEKDANIDFSQERYLKAHQQVKSQMNKDELKDLISTDLLLNERTIAQSVWDLENKNVEIRLLRESQKEWIKYDLDFL